MNAAIEVRAFRREDAAAAAELLSPLSAPDHPITTAVVEHLLDVAAAD